MYNFKQKNKYKKERKDWENAYRNGTGLGG